MTPGFSDRKETACPDLDPDFRVVLSRLSPLPSPSGLPGTRATPHRRRARRASEPHDHGAGPIDNRIGGQMRRGTELHRRQGHLTPVWWPVNWLGRSDWQSARTLSGSGAALGARREAPPRRIVGRGSRSGVRAAGPLRSSEFRYGPNAKSVPQLAAGTSFIRAASPSIPEPACLVRLRDRKPAFSRFAPPAPDRRRRRLESGAAPGSAASSFSRIAAVRGAES